MKKQYYILLFIFLLLPVTLSAQKKLVILHTNDTHSRIEPLPDNDRYNPGKGGIVNRKTIIDSIRGVYSNVLLLDAGDFVQGTPYYNIFKGRVEAESMNRLGYEAGTIGNHEFDYGLDSLRMVIETLNFPIISCNYDFTGTPLEGLTKPYIILNKDGIKVGIIGAGIRPDGLIQKDKYEGMVFKPIIETVNSYAEQLKNKDKCDLIICLSHIGYTQDQELAKQSRNIDIIIGGHSHTYMMDGPDHLKNLDGKEIMVYQAGGTGAFMGMIEVDMRKEKKKKKK